MEQSILRNYLAKISPSHIYEDILLLKKMANVLPCRCMKLTVHKISYVLATAIEKKLHENSSFKLSPKLYRQNLSMPRNGQ